MHRCNFSNTTRRLIKRFRRQDGTAMIELAIVIPVLLSIVFGIIYFGRFFNYASNETHLAAEAARYASVNVNPLPSTQAYIKAQASPELLTTSSDVLNAVRVFIYYPAGSTGKAGDAVRACVLSQVHYLPFLGFANAWITQMATMRLEAVATTWTPDSAASLPAQCSLT